MFDDPEAKCRAILAPYSAVLWQIPHAAWARLLNMPERIVFTPSTRASVVSSLMLDEARTLLLPLAGVRELDNHVSSVFMIGDEIVVRLKHLDDDGLSHNYQTKRARLYNSINESLPGISASALRVDLGYKLNAIQTAIELVSISRRNGKRNDFSYELTEMGAQVLPEQIPLDEPAAAEVVPRVRRRTRPDDAKILKFRQATDDQ